MKNFRLFLLAAICTTAALTIFRLGSLYFLAFPSPWHWGAVDFIGGLGSLLLDMAAALFFLWFFQITKSRVYQNTTWLILIAIIIPIGLHYLQIGLSAILPNLRFITEQINDVIYRLIWLLQFASYAFLALAVIRRIKRPRLALSLAWLAIIVWNNIVLLFIIHLLERLGSGSGSLIFWQYEHPEWLYLYWPEFIGTSFLVTIAWYIYQQAAVRVQPQSGRPSVIHSQ